LTGSDLSMLRALGPSSFGPGFTFRDLVEASSMTRSGLVSDGSRTDSETAVAGAGDSGATLQPVRTKTAAQRRAKIFLDKMRTFVREMMRVIAKTRW